MGYALTPVLLMHGKQHTPGGTFDDLLVGGTQPVGPAQLQKVQLTSPFVYCSALVRVISRHRTLVPAPRPQFPTSASAARRSLSARLSARPASRTAPSLLRAAASASLARRLARSTCEHTAGRGGRVRWELG